MTEPLNMKCTGHDECTFRSRSGCCTVLTDTDHLANGDCSFYKTKVQLAKEKKHTIARLERLGLYNLLMDYGLRR